MAFFFLVILIFTKCIDPYDVNVDQGKKRLIVSGHITSAPGPYYVTLSYSGNYSRTVDGAVEFISDAVVCIHDETDNCIELQEVTTGRYSTGESSFRGETGKSYYLEIVLPDGRSYRSRPEKMKPPPEIDRVYYEYFPGSDLKDEGFYVYIDAKDPPDQVNFYKWDYISWYLYSWDPCWNRVAGSDPFNIESDKNINGNLVARRLIRIVPYNSRFPYVVTVHQLALSEGAFDFLKSLNDQINLSGSIFDPPPTFIWGNIESSDNPDELVLGYFYVAGSSDIEIAVDRNTPEQPPKQYAGILNPPLYCGDPCDPLCVAFGGGKCGFAPCPPECNALPEVTYKPPEAWPLELEICDE